MIGDTQETRAPQEIVLERWEWNLFLLTSLAAGVGLSVAATWLAEWAGLPEFARLSGGALFLLLAGYPALNAYRRKIEKGTPFWKYFLFSLAGAIACGVITTFVF